MADEEKLLETAKQVDQMLKLFVGVAILAIIVAIIAAYFAIWQDDVGIKTIPEDVVRAATLDNKVALGVQQLTGHGESPADDEALDALVQNLRARGYQIGGEAVEPLSEFNYFDAEAVYTPENGAKITAVAKDGDVEIKDASINAEVTSPGGSNTQHVLVYDAASSKYVVSLIPKEKGDYAVSLLASKEGFADRMAEIAFKVDSLPANAAIVEGLKSPAAPPAAPTAQQKSAAQSRWGD